jgi:hypothetical protein
MVSDSALTYSDKLTIIDTDAKVSNINNEIILAGAGDASYFSEFRFFAEEHQPVGPTRRQVFDYVRQFNDWTDHSQPMLLSVNEEPVTTMLMMFKGQAFAIEEKYIRLIDDFYVIGSGAPIVLGAMAMRKDIIKAVEIACKYDVYSKPPLRVITMDRKTFEVSDVIMPL